MSTVYFDWQRFHAYRVFDEFLERFVLHRKSYVTTHTERLDLPAAFKDIQKRFVAAFDDSAVPFEEKIARQFNGAPEQTKIVFANVEYLWAMPVENISPDKKRSYAQRWFPAPRQVVKGKRFFFGYPHTIANPGSWYLNNKYWELVAALRVLSLVAAQPTATNLPELKRQIATICHKAIYEGVPADDKFSTSVICSIHSAVMHLADPERYESIISASHRRRICGVFGHVVKDPSPDTEILLKQIRNTLYDSHGNGEEPNRKYRWFFYSKDVRPLWIDKQSKQAQQMSSAVFDVRNEEEAAELEGEQKEATGYRVRRSSKLAEATKKRDRYTCCACGFHFKDQIVHVHHLDPLSEYERPQKTKAKDLITLCPTCHYLAHYWLRENSRYKQREELLAALKRPNNSSSPTRSTSSKRKASRSE